MMGLWLVRQFGNQAKAEGRGDYEMPKMSCRCTRTSAALG